MEKHRCKLCSRNFANGRALGGHMRSHMMNLYASSSSKPKKQECFMEEIESVPSSSSASGSSSSAESEEEENGGKGLFFTYGLMRTKNRGGGGYGGGMADSDQFCAAADVTAGSSVVLQDRESETESSKNSNTRRRSRRVRKSRISDVIRFSSSGHNNFIQEQKPMSEEVPVSMDAEPVSSISDTTPDEDVAHCLIMMSRDKWNQKDIEEQEEEDEFFAETEEEEEEEEEIETGKNPRHDFGVIKVTKSSRSRGKYRCETCNKAFRSYQALGGHRASHKRVKPSKNNTNSAEADQQIEGNISISVPVSVPVSVSAPEKVHECPVCYRVFSSGQALGGHKRSHVMGAAAANQQHQQISTIVTPADAHKKKPVSGFIDLNLPAPVEEDDDDDDLSQIELSAVSDVDFVNPFKH